MPGQCSRKEKKVKIYKTQGKKPILCVCEGKVAVGSQFTCLSCLVRCLCLWKAKYLPNLWKGAAGDIWPEKPRHKRLSRTLPCRRCWTVGLRSVLAAIGLAFSMENIVMLDLYFWNWFKPLALNNWIVNYWPCFLEGKIVWLLRFEADLNPELLTKEKLISSQLWCVSRVWDQDYQPWSPDRNSLAPVFHDKTKGRMH